MLLLWGALISLVEWGLGKVWIVVGLSWGLVFPLPRVQVGTLVAQLAPGSAVSAPVM